MAGLLAAVSCSTTRSLQDGQYLLAGNRIKADDSRFNTGELGSYLRQKPNASLFGVNPLLPIYNWPGQSDKPLSRFIRKFGVAPVVYDATLVDASIDNMLGHLEYIGYYGSEVESRVEVKGRKVYVTYYVTLGKRFKISSIEYELPESEMFRADFEADQRHITLKPGQYLSESDLEAETVRSSQYFRNQGYYGFTKSYYFFEADTLAGDGTARLTMAIRDYTRNDTPEHTAPHRKFQIGDVHISYPKDIRIRSSVLENLNTLHPGQTYNERNVNATYSRLASLSLFNSVNIAMNPVAEDRVDCDITLQNAGIQGFKTNLEASVNSTGLFGISPQLNYYHKNIFHGSELLNIGVKGNFQFKPDDDVRSTELSTSASIRFPKFLGLPNRLFKGPVVPHTDVNAAFSYQDRPEYKRTIISTAFGYIGNWGRNLFYQVYPFQANIARLFSISDSFYENILSDRFMMNAYSNHFDMGVGGTLYYTTDASAIPSRPFHYYRLNFDLSGNVVSLFDRWMPTDQWGYRTIWETPYSQYVKGELQVGRTLRFGKSGHQAVSTRLLLGAGYAYGNSTSLPFEKQFYSGGASSMRGWQARTLGPGNAAVNKTFVIPSQTGDMKLEANLEYRFPIVWKLEGATFVDVGNIWTLNNSGGDGEQFSFKELPQTIAADWGLGLRVNLDFIMVRLDGGMKVYDPSLDADARWIGPDGWLRRNNFAIHFGVGYPF